MSRETNSILLRYNINKFWSSSLVIQKLQYINILYENLLYFVLSNLFLDILKIQYNFRFINIYIFYFKYDKFNFFYKYLKIKKKLVTQLKSRLQYGLILKVIKPLKNKKYNKWKYFFNLLFLSAKKLLVIVNYKLLSNFFFTFLKEKKLFFFNKKYINKIKKSMAWNYKLKYINHIIKLKIIGLYCSLLILLYTNKKIKINLISITKKINSICLFPFKFKYKRNYILYQKLFIVLISFIFTKSYILNNYINLILKKTKNKKHIKNMILFFSSLKIIFDKQFVPINGIKFKIAGRLNGKLRKASYGYKLGYLKLQRLSLNIDFSCFTVFTQYGSFSLKLWLSNKIIESS